MKLLDLFSGMGGFSHGLVQAGMELVGYCEIDKLTHKSFQILHDPQERLWNAYDIRTIDPIRLPDFDAVCFGWPCQDNSIAGKRKGQIKRDDTNEGNRSGLLFEATRIIRAKRPRYFIAENVEGLLSVNDGKDFYSTIREFTDMGYDIQWQILNTSAYVAQNRRRIFFVGHLRGERRPEIFPFGSENSKSIKIIGNTKPEHCTRHGQRDEVYSVDGIIGALNATDYKQPKTIFEPVAVLTPDRPKKRQNGRRFKEPGEPSFTLTAQDKHGIYDGYRIRKLTSLEYFRLQTYPDEWHYKLKKAGISDSQLYKMAGNGVTSAVSYEIGKRLMSA